jgi:hypothetical protein
MKAILKEENKIEDFKNQSYDIEKLGVSGEIACTKLLLVSTGLSKPKVRSLLQNAKIVSGIIRESFALGVTSSQRIVHILRIPPLCLAVFNETLTAPRHHMYAGAFRRRKSISAR